MTNKNEQNKNETPNEFGEFGEIAVRNCYFCNKTIRQKNCYGFERDKDKPKFTPTSILKPTGIGNYPKQYVCLKCLLKGLWGINPDKKKIMEYLDLYIKTSLSESI